MKTAEQWVSEVSQSDALDQLGGDTEAAALFIRAVQEDARQAQRDTERCHRCRAGLDAPPPVPEAPAPTYKPQVIVLRSGSRLTFLRGLAADCAPWESFRVPPEAAWDDCHSTEPPAADAGEERYTPGPALQMPAPAEPEYW